MVLRNQPSEEDFMGLDIDSSAAALPESDDDLTAIAESAIRRALDANQTSVSFNTVASLAGRENEVAGVVAELQKKFPGLQELVPLRFETGATAYLHKKPGAVRKFLRSISAAEI